MKNIILFLCIIVMPTFLKAQFETEIFPSGIQLPRMNTAQRDSIPTSMGKCIYNTDSQRIECCNAGSNMELCFWGANSTLLIDEDLDSRIQFKEYLVDRMGNTCPPRFDIHKLLSVEIKDNPVIEIKKEDSFSARIEFPDNNNNILLGGKDEESQETNNDNNNILVGNGAGHPLVKGEKNVLIGTRAGHMLADSRNVMIGYESGPQEPNDTIEPTQALDNVYIGHLSGNQRKGAYNVSVGSKAGFDGIGGRNTFVGITAGKFLSGYRNVAIGPLALMISDTSMFNQFANDNIAIGLQAGSNNVGDNNIFIGKNAGNQSSSEFMTSTSNTLIINSGDVGDVPLIKGNFVTDEIMINGDLGIGLAPTEKLEINGSVKIHNLLKLTPIAKPDSCTDESHIGDLYLDEMDMKLRICIKGGAGVEWSELN